MGRLLGQKKTSLIFHI